MAVTPQHKSRAAKTPAGAMKQKRTTKSRNVAAAALADPRHLGRVVNSAKVYSRKDKKPIEDQDL